MIHLPDTHLNIDQDEAVVRKLDKFGRWRTLLGSSTTESHGFIRGEPTFTSDCQGHFFRWRIELTLFDNDAFDTNDVIGIISDPIAIGMPKKVTSNSNGIPT